MLFVSRFVVLSVVRCIFLLFFMFVAFLAYTPRDYFVIFNESDVFVDSTV